MRRLIWAFAFVCVSCKGGHAPPPDHPGAGDAPAPVATVTPQPLPDVPPETACTQWVRTLVTAGAGDHFTPDAALELLWHDRVLDPAEIFPGALPAPGLADVETEWVQAKSDGTSIICTAEPYVVYPCASCPDAPMWDVQFRVAAEIIWSGEAYMARRASIVLEQDIDDATLKTFERPLQDCFSGDPLHQTSYGETICPVLALDDEQTGEAVTDDYGDYWEVMLIRDIAEVLVFDTDGFLVWYERIAVNEMIDDGLGDDLMDYTDPVIEDLGFGDPVISVYEEKFRTPGGQGTNRNEERSECGLVITESTLTYMLWDGSGLREIFSQIVDLYPEDACSATSIEGHDDYSVMVEPQPSPDGGPHDLMLYWEWYAPVTKQYTEVWSWNGEVYEKKK